MDSSEDLQHIPQVMAMEVSALNTYWLVEYLRRYHPDIDVSKLISQVTLSSPCYVRNLQTDEIEEVTLLHLQEPRYWFSNDFVQAIHNLIVEHIPDPRLGYKMGSTLYKTQPLIRTTIGISLLGIHRLAAKVSKEAAKYNRTKQYTIIETGDGFITMRVTHDPGIAVSEFTMQWNAGCLASYGRLAGATNIEISVNRKKPDPKAQAEPKQIIWDLKLTYREPPLFIRLCKALMLCFPWIRKLSEQAEAAEAEHQDQIVNRDKIIQQQTDRLVNIQQNLIDQERRNIEQKLAQISKELVTTEERERKAIAEDLHDSVTQLLALSLNQIKSAQKQSAPQLNLVEMQKNLNQALSDLRSLTFQISPPVLYDFGLEAALEWLVQDVNSRHDMQLLFTNLLKRPLDTGQQQKVTLYRAIRELVINILKHSKTRDGQIMLRIDNVSFVAEVADEGVGFDTGCIKGGFGLFSLEDRLIYMGGKIHILSSPGEGTIIQLAVALDQMGHG